ncbi:MAG: hypothetical protein LBS09_01575 [Bacteroidales bacterium]|jgi:hypothetical protein|nr:hypothetical protein [Bacteroidales bacterium]
MNMRICAFIVSGLLLFLPEISGKQKPMPFSPMEHSIIQTFKEIRETENDSLALLMHLRIVEMLEEAMEHPEMYHYPFDSLKTVGSLYAPRKKFRIIQWNHAFHDGTHRYFALLIFPSRTYPNSMFRLIDMSDLIERPDKQTLDTNQWYGALYYKILPKKRIKGDIYYTLLGADMNTLDTKKKIIDVLVLKKDGTAQFGADDFFELNGWFKNRVIFEYSSAANMYLGYNVWKRRIEFDHLTPLMPYQVGKFEYYEPDFYRDGLKFRKKHWKHSKRIHNYEPKSIRRMTPK